MAGGKGLLPGVAPEPGSHDFITSFGAMFTSQIFPIIHLPPSRHLTISIHCFVSGYLSFAWEIFDL